MSALQWLAIPLIATLTAAVVIPLAMRRAAREMTGQERAAKLRTALGRRGPVRAAGPTE